MEDIGKKIVSFLTTEKFGHSKIILEGGLEPKLLRNKSKNG